MLSLPVQIVAARPVLDRPSPLMSEIHNRMRISATNRFRCVAYMLSVVGAREACGNWGFANWPMARPNPAKLKSGDNQFATAVARQPAKIMRLTIC
jgi:hypothetical protein